MNKWEFVIGINSFSFILFSVKLLRFLADDTERQRKRTDFWIPLKY